MTTLNLSSDRLNRWTYKLSDEMSSYWVNFAKTGDPNGAGLPRWEPFSRESGKIMGLDRQPATEVLPDKGALE